MFVCVVQSPQLGKSYSLFASVTGQLTAETLKLSMDALGTSVLSASCVNVQFQVPFYSQIDESTFATLQWKLFLSYISISASFIVL